MRRLHPPNADSHSRGAAVPLSRHPRRAMQGPLSSPPPDCPPFHPRRLAERAERTAGRPAGRPGWPRRHAGGQASCPPRASPLPTPPSYPATPAVREANGLVTLRRPVKIASCPVLNAASRRGHRVDQAGAGVGGRAGGRAGGRWCVWLPTRFRCRDSLLTPSRNLPPSPFPPLLPPRPPPLQSPSCMEGHSAPPRALGAQPSEAPTPRPLPRACLFPCQVALSIHPLPHGHVARPWRSPANRGCEGSGPRAAARNGQN